jgi:hypothetical protein
MDRNVHSHLCLLILVWRNSPTRARAASFLRFLDHTQWQTTVGRIPLEEWPALRRDLYDNTRHSKETDIHATGGIRNRSRGKRATADPRVRPLSHWDRPHLYKWIIHNTCSKGIRWASVMWIHLAQNSNHTQGLVNGTCVAACSRLHC